MLTNLSQLNLHKIGLEGGEILFVTLEEGDLFSDDVRNLTELLRQFVTECDIVHAIFLNFSKNI